MGCAGRRSRRLIALGVSEPYQRLTVEIIQFKPDTGLNDAVLKRPALTPSLVAMIG